jgi:hypothetical protein
MEPTQGTLKVYLGEFTVVQVKLGAITLNIGKQVHVTIHLGDLPHEIKAGDTLPLFTELTHAHTRQTPIQ